MRRTSRASVAGLLALGVLAACDLGLAEDPGEENVSSDTQEVEGCSGTGFSIFEQVCAVGESGGRPAINFRGQWFSLDYNGGNWIVANGVGAQASAVAPVDSIPHDSQAQCFEACELHCNEFHCNPGAFRHCLEFCASAPYRVDEQRQFSWTVAGRTYTMTATQTVENQRTVGGQQEMKIGRNLLLTFTTNDPFDGNPWTIVLHPVRAKNGATDQVQANWEVTEPGATTAMGDYNQLFPASQVNVQFTPSVELMSAVKTSAPGTTEMLARSNAAMNRALDAALPPGSSFQNHLEAQALQVSSNVLGRVPGASGSGSYDLQRFSQFYMDDRRGHVGYSEKGQGERPLAQSTKRDWRFRHNIVNYELYFPFLAGICGFEVWVNSYIAGALSFGQRSCFDGVPVDVNMAGNLEFALKAAGGFGCNVVLASASAGLGAGVRAAAQFSTSIDGASVPPALKADLNIYSYVNYAAHFKVRVLFWTKKWEKLLGEKEVFQKSASYRLGAQHPDESFQLCSLAGSPTETGTCDDPEASCDVEGRCIRYNFTSTGEPERADVGRCDMAACGGEVVPAEPPDDTFEMFATPAPACRWPDCNYPHELENGNGLPDGFNSALLAIPGNAVKTVLITSDRGKRATLYRWDDKAVIEISGVGTSGSTMRDVEECLVDFVSEDLLSATASAVIAKLNELYGSGVAKSNVLVRGHSLGSLDTFRILENTNAAPGNAILLGVPLHAVVRLNNAWYGRNENPFPDSKVGFVVSDNDLVARGFGPKYFGLQYLTVWCTTKKGRFPFRNGKLPDNIKFSVVETPGATSIHGHFISNYCSVAPVTCFREQ